MCEARRVRRTCCAVVRLCETAHVARRSGGVPPCAAPAHPGARSNANTRVPGSLCRAALVLWPARRRAGSCSGSLSADRGRDCCDDPGGARQHGPGRSPSSRARRSRRCRCRRWPTCCGCCRRSTSARAASVACRATFAMRGASFGQMLVLVDGVRLNDAQSGHHNGDIPVPLDDVERIEVLHGPGSSLFGADAFGGTINVITRRRHRSAAARAFTAAASGAPAWAAARLLPCAGRSTQTVRCSFDRSGGFMYDRDFNTTLFRSRTSFGGGIRRLVSLLRERVRRQQLLRRQCAVARMDEPDARSTRTIGWAPAAGWLLTVDGVVSHARRSLHLQPARIRRCPTTGTARTRARRS